MKQVTLRLDDDLARGVAGAAAERGTSVNAFAAAVLAAAVDPDLAGDEAERIRARLRARGLLASPPSTAIAVDPDALVTARAAAGRGRPLSAFVGDGRGER
ncbi:MAG: hypothetical protein M0P31_16795 [Solirubrobacteraceae bacterium]|nr:hypothetical protein [Solirubrobacteraceae bacterium]